MKRIFLRWVTSLLLFFTITLAMSHLLLLADQPDKKNTPTYTMWGTHNQESPIYQSGQEMIFSVKVLKDGEPVDGVKLKWTRTGDDGITENGECRSAKEGGKIKASTEKPGFVRLYVAAYDENNRRCIATIAFFEKRQLGLSL